MSVQHRSPKYTQNCDRGIRNAQRQSESIRNRPYYALTKPDEYPAHTKRPTSLRHDISRPIRRHAARWLPTSMRVTTGLSRLSHRRITKMMITQVGTHCINFPISFVSCRQEVLVLSGGRAA